MAYKIDLSKDAREDLARIDAVNAKRIVKKLLWYSGRENTFLYAKRLTDPIIGDIRFRASEDLARPWRGLRKMSFDQQHQTKHPST